MLQKMKNNPMKILNTMKAMLILTAIITFHLSSIFAGNTGSESPAPSPANEVCVECPFLSPVIPMEAPYEDQADVKTLMEKTRLSPEIPMEAGFSDRGIEEDVRGCLRY